VPRDAGLEAGVFVIFGLQVLREENAQQLMPWSVKKQMLLDVASGMVYLHTNTPPVSLEYIP
jgi:hypothetical protein